MCTDRSRLTIAVWRLSDSFDGSQGSKQASKKKNKQACRPSCKRFRESGDGRGGEQYTAKAGVFEEEF